MVNPCFCGCSLQTASLIFAVLDMVFTCICGILALIAGGICIGASAGAAAAGSAPPFISITNGAEVGIVTAIFLVLVLILSAKFYHALTLKAGAEQKDYQKCRIWFIVSAVISTLDVITVVSILIIFGFARVHWQTAFVVVAPLFIGEVYSLFSMWVVFEFMKQIKTRQHAESYLEFENI